MTSCSSLQTVSASDRVATSSHRSRGATGTGPGRRDPHRCEEWLEVGSAGTQLGIEILASASAAASASRSSSITRPLTGPSSSSSAGHPVAGSPSDHPPLGVPLRRTRRKVERRGEEEAGRRRTRWARGLVLRHHPRWGQHAGHPLGPQHEFDGRTVKPKRAARSKGVL
jgi:hypothetical protein